jgi:hypothetical protein
LGKHTRDDADSIIEVPDKRRKFTPINPPELLKLNGSVPQKENKSGDSRTRTTSTDALQAPTDRSLRRPKQNGSTATTNTASPGQAPPFSNTLRKAKPGRPPCKGRITYTEVYQGGSAQYKHMIVEYPQSSDFWFILKCVEHGVHFGKNAFMGGAKHLHSDQHKNLPKTYNVAIEKLGYLVEGCNKMLASQNNKVTEAAILAGYKPLNYNMLSVAQRRSLGQAASPSKTDPVSQVMNGARDMTIPDSSSSTPTANAKLSKALKTPKVFTGLTHPEPGHLYMAYWKQEKTRYVVIILPLQGELLPVCGLQGRMEDTDLYKKLPQCYNFDSITKKITGWAKGYEDGGQLVTKRQFPVSFFDKRQYDTHNPVLEIQQSTNLRSTSSSLGWVKARNLTPFDFDDPDGGSILNFDIARNHYARLNGFADYAGMVEAQQRRNRSTSAANDDQMTNGANASASQQNEPRFSFQPLRATPATTLPVQSEVPLSKGQSTGTDGITRAVPTDLSNKNSGSTKTDAGRTRLDGREDDLAEEPTVAEAAQGSDQTRRMTLQVPPDQARPSNKKSPGAFLASLAQMREQQPLAQTSLPTTPPVRAVASSLNGTAAAHHTSSTNGHRLAADPTSAVNQDERISVRSPGRSIFMDRSGTPSIPAPQEKLRNSAGQTNGDEDIRTVPARNEAPIWSKNASARIASGGTKMSTAEDLLREARAKASAATTEKPFQISRPALVTSRSAESVSGNVQRASSDVSEAISSARALSRPRVITEQGSPSVVTNGHNNQAKNSATSREGPAETNGTAKASTPTPVSESSQHWSPNTPQRRNVAAIAFAALQATRLSPPNESAKSADTSTTTAIASSKSPPRPIPANLKTERSSTPGSGEEYYEVGIYRDSVGQTFLRQTSGAGLRLTKDETGNAMRSAPDAAVNVVIDPLRWTSMVHEEQKPADGKGAKYIVRLNAANGKWAELTFEEAVVNGRRMHAVVQARVFRRWMREVNPSVSV